MRHGGVVDRQNLYGLLMRQHRPVYHLSEVAEVSYSEALFGTQREDRYSHSRPFPVGQGKVNITVAHSQRFVGTYLRVGHVAVGIILPCHGMLFFLVVKNELILQWEIDQVGVYLNLPFGKVGIAHEDGFVGIPVAQGFLVSAKAQAMVFVDVRRVCLYQQSFFVAFRRVAAFRMCQQRFRKSRRVEVLLFGQVFPTVLQTVSLLFIA